MLDRRTALASSVLLATAPLDWREYTALAPLGPAGASVGGAKRTRLPLAALCQILGNDLVRGAHGRGGYFVSGDLTPEIFADDCRFSDPTNDVTSLAKYVKALSILFDTGLSSVELLDGPVADEPRRTISATIRAQGTLKLPWSPRIAPWSSDIVWSVSEEGLITEQRQVWSVSATDALLQTFGLPPLHETSTQAARQEGS